MANHPADKRIAVNATPQEVHDFLQKLCSDDGFRTRFKDSPAECLAEHHLHLPVTDLPEEARLPDAAALKKALDHYRETGELDLIASRSSHRWPVSLFWWLYYNPDARPAPSRAKPCARAQALKVTHDDTPEQSKKSMEMMRHTRVGVHATPRELFSLVMRLASDDEFRDKMLADPSATLSTYHVYVPPHAHIIIPDKEMLQEALLNLMSGHTQAMVLLPYEGDNASDVSWFTSFLCFLGQASSK